MTADDVRGDAAHLTIVDLRTQMVTGDGTGEFRLSVQSLTAVATRTGLGVLIDHFGPDNVAVTTTFSRPGSGNGADVAVQASRWGFRANLNVQLRLHPETVGAIQIELVPGRGWSPADLAMLSIIRNQLASQVKQHPALVRTGPRSFEVDIQNLVEGALSRDGLPLHWGAALGEIEPSGDEIRFHFSPLLKVVEASRASRS